MSKSTRKRANSSTEIDDNVDKKSKSSSEIVIINKEIKTLDDLIELGLSFNSNKKYNINLEKLNKIVPVLKKLQNTIGMSGVKKSIVGQIIYFLQDFQDKNEDMLHTVIQGPPGVGKTMLGHIIGEIYWNLDIIQDPNKTTPIFPKQKNKFIDDEDDDDFIDDDEDYSDDDEDYNPRNYNSQLKKLIKSINRGPPSKNTRNATKSSKVPELKFKIAKRADLIAKYLGQTAPKTQEVIDDALGGVLFIDEAYSLGSPDGRDSFAKECIDTINQNLTEKKNQILVIIAGYEDALEECFFSVNEGLNRRFPFRYTIDAYTHEELAQIFCKMVKDINLKPDNTWTVDISQTKLYDFFKKNHDLFPNFGGDIESFLLSVKIQHGIRVFCLPSEKKRKIIYEDLENALKIYRVNKEIKSKNSDIKEYVRNTMYV
jgi:SpoVK/Ycf46/Vps4 family AAA+-type ATPase